MNGDTGTALRGALERMAGGLDDNPERYEQVAARVRRRRQRRVASGMAAAVLLIAGSVTAVATGFPAMEDGEQVGTAPDNDCPAPVETAGPQALPSVEQAGPLVPEGPIAVRVCGPLDTTLRRDLDRLVAAINQASPPPPPDQWFCTEEFPQPLYHLVFAYPDGSQMTAIVEPGNCRTIRVGDQIRLQGRTVIAGLVEELAEEQR